jgi:hypothetical protein
VLARVTSLQEEHDRLEAALLDAQTLAARAARQTVARYQEAQFASEVVVSGQRWPDRGRSSAIARY